MFNHKTHNADSKNNTGDSRNNHGDSNNNNADLKNNNVDSKMNRDDSRNIKPDSKNNNADLKNNPDFKTNADAPSQGDGGGDHMPPPSAAAQPQERQWSHYGNKVYKSGPLFLSSKGIGWTSWKKRWFILTETSLVFFRSDPNAASQKGGEANLTLGGIDLNSSGSVVVKADKKLLTVLFPDGRDGRAFTLKAETSEDLFEWKDALEAALANAPSAGTGLGQNGILDSKKGDNADGSQEQSKDQSPAKSTVLGRPILLALEDIDGTPSFLEKGLSYIEDYGVRVEGILRQAADVDDVERRIREYEQGKTEFTADEDGHVIGDCIKFVLRELPSPPVPASCCAALLEAYRTDRATRVNAMRAAICDTFPEPNRRLLQRILIMMEAVAENKAVNRMSVSAVAACMSPLLLRPLLAGDVELGKGLDIGGDGSAQLLQAAAAANHAQAIVITLVEEYDKIFGEEDMLSDLYSDSDDYGSESEELSDEYYEEDEDYEDDEDVDAECISEGSRSYEDSEHGSSISCSKSGDDGDSSQHHSKGSVSSNSISSEVPDNLEVSNDVPKQLDSHLKKQVNESVGQSEDDSAQEFIARKPIARQRTGAKKILSTESIEFVIEQQAEILRLEATKAKLKERFEAEARRNALLKKDLVSKKNALEVRRVALKQEVSRLEEELQKEKGSRKHESGQSQGAISLSVSTDEKTNADPDDIKQAEADDPGLQQNQQHEQNSNVTRDSGYQQSPSADHGKAKDKEKDREATTTSQKSKDTHGSKEQSDKHHFHSFSNKRPPNQQSDSARNEQSISKSTSSRKSHHSKGEAANTTSALSKITNRLNFLKERRNQIADELQYIDKDHKSHKHNKGSRKWSESSQAADESNTQSSDKAKGSETHHHSQKESSFQQRETPMDKGGSEDQSTNQGQGRTFSR